MVAFFAVKCRTSVFISLITEKSCGKVSYGVGKTFLEFSAVGDADSAGGFFQ
jgi:hypothetical protein